MAKAKAAKADQTTEVLMSTKTDALKVLVNCNLDGLVEDLMLSNRCVGWEHVSPDVCKAFLMLDGLEEPRRVLREAAYHRFQEMSKLSQAKGKQYIAGKLNYNTCMAYQQKAEDAFRTYKNLQLSQEQPSSDGSDEETES